MLLQTAGNLFAAHWSLVQILASHDSRGNINRSSSLTLFVNLSKCNIGSVGLHV